MPQKKLLADVPLDLDDKVAEEKPSTRDVGDAFVIRDFIKSRDEPHVAAQVKYRALLGRIYEAIEKKESFILISGLLPDDVMNHLVANGFTITKKGESLQYYIITW